jgi:uncharacterized protein YrrD
MLRTIENVIGYRLMARDGEIGAVYDFFLDDEHWRLRHAVVETGTWLNRRRVLVDPRVLGTIDAERREIMVVLTRDEVRRGPGVDTHQPVSRQQEILMAAHNGWPAYAWPGPLLGDPQIAADGHLRSLREISSYAVQIGRGDTGQVRDFVVDDRDWAVLQVVAAFGGWMNSRLTALPVDAIEEISWAERCIRVAAAGKPEAWPLFDYGALVNRFENVVYFDYFGRPVERALAS